MLNRIVSCRSILLIFAVGFFVIGITNVGNTDPEFTAVGSTATRSIAENAAVGTDVGSAFTAKSLCFAPIRFDFPNHTNKFDYDVDTDDNINYTIQIETKVSLDYETQSSYTVRLILEEYDYTLDRWREADRVTVTISVTDVDESSQADPLPTFTSEERERITSFFTLDTIIFSELFNASNNQHDWIELQNVSNTDIDFSGWRLVVVTSETAEVLQFSAGTVLSAGEQLLILNTDPNEPDMPLAVSEEASYHYLVDEGIALPQEDFMLLLRSPSGWEDGAGSYLFGQEKSPAIVNFGLDIAWFRAKSSVLGHRAEAWVESGYQNGLGYDENASQTLALGTPGYPHKTLVGDANGDGIVNILDLVLVASQIGQSGESAADINSDGTVNIQDLVVIANSLGHVAAAPSVKALTATQVEQWLKLAKQNVSIPSIHTSLSEGAFSYELGIQVLEQLLQSLIPKTTVLLPNYPNPFNPETWIPYQLATASDVQITIYDAHGTVVRQFNLGHQPAGSYQSRSRAVYWDGTNALAESVASGIYFYTLITENFSATRKMLILK